MSSESTISIPVIRPDTPFPETTPLDCLMVIWMSPLSRASLSSRASPCVERMTMPPPAFRDTWLAEMMSPEFWWHSIPCTRLLSIRLARRLTSEEPQTTTPMSFCRIVFPSARTSEEASTSRPLSTEAVSRLFDEIVFPRRRMDEESHTWRAVRRVPVTVLSTTLTFAEDCTWIPRAPPRTATPRRRPFSTRCREIAVVAALASTVSRTKYACVFAISIATSKSVVTFQSAMM